MLVYFWALNPVPFIYVSMLYQYYTIFIAFSYTLKLGSVMPLALFFLLKIALATQGLLWFHTNLRGVYSICVKMPLEF